ncbi:hypothetical protein BDS110ZK25_70540 [Bradyrhizobium diazoefficiens]
MAMLNAMRKTCPVCGAPMRRVADETEDGRRERYVCAECDGIDPLHDPGARGWAESPLRPPSNS